MKKLLITVTTVPGNPTFELPPETENREIQRVVEERYGMQDNGSWGLPHSYCGGIFPHEPIPHAGGQVFMTQRGHHRVF